ncbi:hypothetical protein Leryth_014030 [Lithospermum erythrorhizon]|nr:hypothetical protein Leryth_014030 [Lithospermum erythrorhizon]
MFKSTSSKNHHKPLQIVDGGGGRGRSKSKTQVTTCKKHPKHEQSPGVCAVCLREKLNHLPASSSKITRGKNNVASASTSSYLSSLSSQESSNVSSSSSPVHRRSHSSMTTFLKWGKKNNETNNYSISSKNIVLTKSRSLAFLMQRTEAEEAVDKHHGKKTQGFWSKLLRRRTRNK